MVSETQFGSLGISSILKTSSLPVIVSEWAGLIPITFHLALPTFDYQLTGEISLTGRLFIGIFPRLGVFKRISQLLEREFDFTERAAVSGGVGAEVWDVLHGSRFPSANGAAAAILNSFVLSKLKPQRTLVEDLPSSLQENKEPPCTVTTSVLPAGQTPTQQPAVPRQQFKRHQTLHVLFFSRNVRKPSYREHKIQMLQSFLSSSKVEILRLVALLSCTLVLCLFGLYGTAAAVFTSCISNIFSMLITLPRPSTLLDNNLENTQPFGCMLSGAHQNCSTWYLYAGDRGVVDGVLNKPMLDRAPVRKSVRAYACWFSCAHVLQLLAMTYVGAQKGWDGVAMVIAMLLDFVFGVVLYNHHFIARRFLLEQGVHVKARTLEFTGRKSMIAAVHAYSGSQKVGWMDDILVPDLGRNATLERVLAGDIAVVSRQERLAIRGLKMLKAEFPLAGL